MARKTLTPRQRLDKLNSYNSKYTKEHFVSMGLKFNREKDADVMEWLDKQSNKKDSICRLIREQIARESE